FYRLFYADTGSTAIYTLSLHDALPISACARTRDRKPGGGRRGARGRRPVARPGDRRRGARGGAHDQAGDQPQLRDHGHAAGAARSEEHTSELQSREKLVCRLLLEKKK